MNNYLSLKLGDPFISFFSSQAGTQVKTIVVHNLNEKNLAKQISKLTLNDTDTNIVFSPDLTKHILDTPGFFEKLSTILEEDYSIGILYEKAGSYLHFYPVLI